MHAGGRLPRPILVLLTAWLVAAAGNGFARAGDDGPLKLLAEDGLPGDQFGFAVALDGDTAVIGAVDGDALDQDTGTACVFVRGVDGWTQQARLVAADGASDDGFGWSVAVSGELVAVGAPGDDEHGADSGSVYVFEREGDVWVRKARLHPREAGAGDGFGSSVALRGERLLVGAWMDQDEDGAGAAYVFERVDGAWLQRGRLAARDGRPGDDFGVAVALGDDLALVGAHGDDALGEAAGCAWVFEHGAGGWRPRAKLLADDGQPIDLFGQTVAVSGATLIVGAPGADGDGFQSGSAYVFVRRGQAWVSEAELTAADGSGSDAFGFAVAVHGDRALVGAYTDDHAGAAAGSAYLFTRDGGTWTQGAKLLPADVDPFDFLGVSVALDDETILVGAHGDDDGGPNAGAAWVFDP